MLKLPHCKLELDVYEQKQLYAFLVVIWTKIQAPSVSNPPTLYLSASLMDRYFGPALVSKIKGGLHSGKFKFPLPESTALFQLIQSCELDVLNQYEPMMGKLIRTIHPFLLECTDNPTLRVFQNIDINNN